MKRFTFNQVSDRSYRHSFWIIRQALSGSVSMVRNVNQTLVNLVNMIKLFCQSEKAQNTHWTVAAEVPNFKHPLLSFIKRISSKL